MPRRRQAEVNFDLESESNDHPPKETESTSPPDTILIRWAEELLLLDAWNTDGTRLRTPPSLIGEAIAHFQLPYDVKDYRLAVHEKVDGRPALLFLGVSALRFIENGRVLEMVEVRNRKLASPIRVDCNTPIPEDGDESWETAQIFHDDDNQSDFSTASSPSLQSVDEKHEGNQRRPSRRLFSIAESSRPRTTPPKKAENPSAFHSSSPDILPSEQPPQLVSRRHRPDNSTYIYVHPKYGALFAHLGPNRSQLDNGSPTRPQTPIESQVLQEGLEPMDSASLADRSKSPAQTTYDFRVMPSPRRSQPPSALPTPREELAQDPLVVETSSSNRISRNPSYASNLSRQAGGPSPRSRKPDDDPWLSSEGSRSWKEKNVPSPEPTKSARRHRSQDRMRPDPADADKAEIFGLPRPKLMQRAYSSAAVSNVQKQRYSHSKSRSGI